MTAEALGRGSNVPSGLSSFDLLRDRLGWHPEWPSLALCAGVWSGLILEAALSPAVGIFCGREPGLTLAPAA